MGACRRGDQNSLFYFRAPNQKQRRMPQSLDPPRFPAGPYQSPRSLDAEVVSGWVELLQSFPEKLRCETEELNAEMLGAPYRNWTIRRIVHHLADSHMNAFIRFKLALTEEMPTIKPYLEGRWSETIDATQLPIESSLKILDGLHHRWAAMAGSLSSEERTRTYYHPETNSNVRLDEMLAQYVWHGEHHVAQIRWVKTNRLGLQVERWPSGELVE